MNSVIYNDSILEKFIPITYRELVETSLSLFKDLDDKKFIENFGEDLRERFHSKFYGNHSGA
jgi:hypothetical protein